MTKMLAHAALYSAWFLSTLVGGYFVLGYLESNVQRPKQPPAAKHRFLSAHYVEAQR